MSLRILVIRGGAVGDFIVTLPAIGLLRKAWPEAHIEIMGKRPVLNLAVGRYYADKGRSIEDPSLAAFYLAGVTLPENEKAYFASFDLIVGYLPDAERVFQRHLEQLGFERVCRELSRNAVVNDGSKYLIWHDSRSFARPAAAGFCQPLAWLGLRAGSYESRVFPSAEDHRAADELMVPRAGLTVAIHPGSGSVKKNWTPENWEHVAHFLVTRYKAGILLLGGEAEVDLLAQMHTRLQIPHRLICHQPLTVCAALLAQCDLFLGHDSGISHLAAAVGVKCLLLFGPSDAAVWAPPGKGVRIVRGDGRMDSLTITGIQREIEAHL